MNKNRRNITHSIGFLGMFVFGVTSTGCQRSVAPDFYTLTPALQPMLQSHIKLIEIIPIGLPARLNTPLMVIQNPDGKTYQLDNRRWSSILSDELQSAISTGLQQQLGAIDVYNTGFTGGQTVYTVATEFSRFDIVKQEKQADIEVIASWVVKAKYNPKSMNNSINTQQQLNCRMTFKKTVLGSNDDYLEIVKSYQASVQYVTTAIATSILAFDSKQKIRINDAVCN